MAKQHRKFSVEQELQIIQEAEQNGVTQTICMCVAKARIKKIYSISLAYANTRLLV